MAEVTAETLVDERYRLGDRIGSGGMADVYLAEDTQLGRDVAIKLLHRRFARDEAFVERFRREASAAAGLQHPHVVNVFDRGEHDGTYYIAMEHLGGRTLKQVITDDAPLPQERTIDLGVQILEAAGFAHERGVVHRDFKPHNVIVDRNDDVKVTDFGIARAGASEITETGSILGTAQYLSPEQAQGGGTEAASDIYSIGVILYELLTGRLPFEGESAVAIAVKHLTEEPPRVAEFRPDVHPALEAAVMKALVKDPKHRYRDAAEFSAALQSARAAIAMGDDGQGTAVWAPLTGIPEEEEPPKRRRRLLWLLLPLLLAAALLYFLVLAGPPQVAVPDVVGDTLGVAQPELEDAGFAVEVERQHDPAPLNDVISQDPEPAAEVDEGSTVTLFVSKGPVDVRVPDVVGLGQEEAVKKLQNAGLEANVDSQYSLEVADGLVIATAPEAKEEIPRGSAVDLTVSAGPRPVEVPDVIGESSDGAAATLEGLGLAVAVDEVESSQQAGTVIDQDPAAGTTVDEGSQVTLTVSTGPAVDPEPRRPPPEEDPAPEPEPETATIPGVVGSTRADASGALRAAGFGVSTAYETTDQESQDGIVLSQSPGGGTEAKPGTTVQIVVGQYEEPPPPPEEEGGGGQGQRRAAPGGV
jgi:serine/threonine-protein kinase